MKVKYPRLVSLIFMLIVAYIIFALPATHKFFSSLGEYSYLGALIAGFLFAFSFSSPIAISIFLIIDPSNVWLATAIGGCGAVLGDMIILNVIKKGYKKEFKRLKSTRTIDAIRHHVNNMHATWFKKSIAYVLGAIVIVTPLPDEIGVSLLAGFTKINQKIFLTMSFLLHALGILVIIWLPY